MAHQELVVVWVAVVAAVMAVTGESAVGGVVPNIPVGVTLDTSSLYNIWSHALRKQEPGTRSTHPDIGTLISPAPFLMMNLVPMDGPHPLYSEKYTNLRTEFLKDYMIEEKVSPDDARMSQPNGLTVTNFNGKQLTFKKDTEGKMTVEGIVLEGMETLEGGIVSYTLSGFLSDHRTRVNEALNVLRKESSGFGPLGSPLYTPKSPQ